MKEHPAEHCSAQSCGRNKMEKYNLICFAKYIISTDSTFIVKTTVLFTSSTKRSVFLGSMYKFSAKYFLLLTFTFKSYRTGLQRSSAANELTKLF